MTWLKRGIYLAVLSSLIVFSFCVSEPRNNITSASSSSSLKESFSLNTDKSEKISKNDILHDKKTSHDISSSVSSSLSSASSSSSVKQENRKEFLICSLEMNRRYGDGILLKYGNFEMLVDGGYQEDREGIKRALSTYIEDGVLDYVICSHPHEDHLGAIESADAFSGVKAISHIIDNGDDYGVQGDFHNNVVKHYVPLGTEYTPIQEVVRNPEMKDFKVDDDFSVHFLNSAAYSNVKNSRNKNNGSIGFYIRYGKTVLFMAGDAEGQQCNNFINGNEDFTSKDDFVIFKGLHHGSKGTNNNNILSWLEPDFCFVSAAFTIDEGSAPNFSQHPYYEAIERIAEYTTDIYWNGINGDLKITASKEGVTSVRGRGRTHSYSTYDKKTGTKTPVDNASEKDTNYLASQWYLNGVSIKGWNNYLGL